MTASIILISLLAVFWGCWTEYCAQSVSCLVILHSKLSRVWSFYTANYLLSGHSTQQTVSCLVFLHSKLTSKDPCRWPAGGWTLTWVLSPSLRYLSSVSTEGPTSSHRNGAGNSEDREDLSLILSLSFTVRNIWVACQFDNKHQNLISNWLFPHSDIWATKEFDCFSPKSGHYWQRPEWNCWDKMGRIQTVFSSNISTETLWSRSLSSFSSILFVFPCCDFNFKL